MGKTKAKPKANGGYRTPSRVEMQLYRQLREARNVLYVNHLLTEAEDHRVLSRLSKLSARMHTNPEA